MINIASIKKKATLGSRAMAASLLATISRSNIKHVTWPRSDLRICYYVIKHLAFTLINKFRFICVSSSSYQPTLSPLLYLPTPPQPKELPEKKNDCTALSPPYSIALQDLLWCIAMADHDHRLAHQRRGPQRGLPHLTGPHLLLRLPRAWHKCSHLLHLVHHKHHQ